MAEYVLGEGEERSDVARRLLAQVGSDRADQVTWIPRADVNGGGVFLIPEDVDKDAAGVAATTEHGTPKSQGEYPYDGTEQGDPERREDDQAAQDAQTTEADEDESPEVMADEEPAEETPTLPQTRRRRAPAASNSTTDQQ
jgi:hypothetical protein